MKDSIRQRLEEVRRRHEEIAALLAAPEVVRDQPRFRDLSREYARLEPIIGAWNRWRAAERAENEARALAAEEDSEMRAMAEDEARRQAARRAELDEELQRLLLPRDPDDDADLYLEVRAGTGGDEAALFAGDLFRMYQRYAERQGWSVDVLSASPGEHGGFREVISRVAGDGAYGLLKFESGTHRVQRVPETESQGRIHTSACTVAILPEREEVEAVTLDPSELRIDTFRSSGAGGQHVNTTDSAIRITHLPSGIVVECQDERSQHKNRARAMALLQARLLDAERTRQAAAEARERKLQVGSGDRSQRIRTYNFPQGRITDHRIGLTIHQLEDVLDGQLEPLLGPLAQEHQAERLAELEDGGTAP